MYFIFTIPDMKSCEIIIEVNYSFGLKPSENSERFSSGFPYFV